MTIARVISGRDPSAIVRAVPTMSMQEGIDLLARHRIGAVPVVEGPGAEDGPVVGVFSERDATYCLAREGAAALDRPLAEVMTAPVITITLQTTVLEALSMMTARRFRHLPVVEDGKMIGLVSMGDLVKHRLDAVEREAEAMRSYIQAT